MLIFAILFFFRSQCDVADLTLIILLLCSHTDIIGLMKYSVSYFILIPISIVSSPVMLYTWAYTGTGNANYLFFQGLVLQLGYGLFIVDFIGAYEKLVSTTMEKAQLEAS